MFATEHEGVIPDMEITAKGLTGSYIPLVITLISEKLFSAFDAPVGEGKAADVCIEARCHGLLTRPLGNVVVLMPPLCITVDQLTKAVNALRLSITKVCGDGGVIAKNDAEEITA